VPFAVIAPLIGPALDRLAQARRWALAATGFGRSALAVLMAFNFDTVFVLFPLALGSLVLSKSYGIVRASSTSHVTPETMTLVAANSRLSVFGLGASAIGGGAMIAFLRLTQWYPAGLCAAAMVFVVGGALALRLDRAIDMPARPDRPAGPGQNGLLGPEPGVDGGGWQSRRRQFRGRLETALSAESMLRSGAGFLTIFLAFHIEQTSRGYAASVAFASILVGSGLGQLTGTVTGARVRSTHPQRLILVALALCCVTFVVAASTFSLPTAIGCVALTSLTNSLGKVSLDSIIQRDMPRRLISRAFARSETMLQLAWVLGAILALLLPTEPPQLAVGIAAAGLLAGASVVGLRARQRRERS